MNNEDLTTAQVAAQLDKPERTIRLWCKQGRLAGARPIVTPRGIYWLIPQNALKGFKEPQRGRPSKQAAATNKKKPDPQKTTRKLNKAFR